MTPMKSIAPTSASELSAGLGESAARSYWTMWDYVAYNFARAVDVMLMEAGGVAVGLGTGTTKRQLYGAVINRGLYNTNSALTPAGRATAWVEAENTEKVFAVLIDWFRAMQDGTAKDRYPDPLFKTRKGLCPLSTEVASKLVREVEADFGLEVPRMQHTKAGTVGPGYDLLAPEQQMALAQDVYRVLMTDSEIEEEAKRRLARGESVPPTEQAQPIPTAFTGIIIYNEVPEE